MIKIKTTLSRLFPYEKNIVINALYDTLEALGLCLDSSDSVRGMVVVSDSLSSGSMEFILSAKSTKDCICTKVDVFLLSSDVSKIEKWSHVILDELYGTLKRAYCNDKQNDLNK